MREKDAIGNSGVVFKQPISMGVSPCQNDCFIFDALVHKRIDREGLELEVVMADVEELNRRAFAGTIDVTKLSYHAYAHLLDSYVLLDAGSARSEERRVG